MQLVEIGERIKEIRKEKNKSQEQIAKQLKTTQEQYSRYETGKRKLNVEQLYIICKYLNISADYLLGLTQIYTELPKK